jgi:hypothetical protein
MTDQFSHIHSITPHRDTGSLLRGDTLFFSRQVVVDNVIEGTPTQVSINGSSWIDTTSTNIIGKIVRVIRFSSPTLKVTTSFPTGVISAGLTNVSKHPKLVGIDISPLAQLDPNITDGNYTARGSMVNDSDSGIRAIFPAVYYIDTIDVYVRLRTYQMRPVGLIVSTSFDNLNYTSIIQSSTVTLAGEGNTEKLSISVKSLAKFLHIRIKTPEYFFFNEIVIMGKPTAFVDYPVIDLVNNTITQFQGVTLLSTTLDFGNSIVYSPGMNLNGFTYFKCLSGKDTIWVEPKRDIIVDNLLLSATHLGRGGETLQNLIDCVNIIREMDFGTFWWHDSYPRRRKYTTDMLTNTQQQATYMDWNTQVTNNTLEQWIENTDYLDLYFETKDVRYMDMWFKITADYFDKLPAILLTKSTKMIGTLEEVTRHVFIVKQLAGFCKTMVRSTDQTWETVLFPVAKMPAVSFRTQLRNDFFKIIHGFKTLMNTNYLYARSNYVANQRFQGIYPEVSIGEMLSVFRDYQMFYKSGVEDVLSFTKSNQFPDGGMLEQSWNYNTLVTEMLSELKNRGIPTEVDQFNTYMASVLSPLYTLPLLGSYNNTDYPKTWLTQQPPKNNTRYPSLKMPTTELYSYLYTKPQWAVIELEHYPLANLFPIQESYDGIQAERVRLASLQGVLDVTAESDEPAVFLEADKILSESQVYGWDFSRWLFVQRLEGVVLTVDEIAYHYKLFQQSPIGKKSSTVFNKYVGLHALRTGYGWSDMYLSFVNSRPMRGHRLRQNNCFEFFCHGRRLLCGSGSPMYTSDGTLAPAYFSEPSTICRNTIVVNGKSQNAGNELLSTENVPIIDEEYTVGLTVDTVSGTFNSGYEASKVIHKRRILFDKEAFIVVVLDTITNVTEPVDISQIWCFPPPEVDGFANDTVKFGDGKVFTDDGVQNPQIEIIHPSKNFTYTKYFGVNTATEYKGWFSPSIFAKKIPKADVWCNARISVETRFCTVVNPRKTATDGVTVISLTPTELTLRKNGGQYMYKL